MNLTTQKTLYRSLLLGAASAALASSAAFAQADAGVETVVVTGSLIQHTAGDQPIPTVIIDADTIAKTGQPNIGAVLAQLPQVANAGDLTPTNSNFLTGGFGVSNVDLRNLGADRTLVLVNGRRWVTGQPTVGAVDLNTIPTALIERIETTTGGASAAYGSDAIAGVVNIILKQDFEGIQANVQYGGTTRGDGGDLSGSVTVGGNFLDGKGNVTVSMSYENSQKVMSGDRDITSTDATQFPGLFECVGTTDCAFLGGATYSSYSLAGRFKYGVPNANGQIVGGGTAYTVDPDDTTRVFNLATDGYDRNPHRYIQVPVIRRLISEEGHIDVFPWARFFFEGTYAYTSSESQLEPYPGSSEDGLSVPVAAGGTGILIPNGNPFIPADLAALAPANSPGLFFYRRFNDLGFRDSRADRDMARVALGFEGDFGKSGILEDWKWNASYVLGRTAESQQGSGYYDKIKLQNALNAHEVGDPAFASTDQPGAATATGLNGNPYVCNDPAAQASGCVPVDLFGANAITPLAASYISGLVTQQDRAIQQVATLQANGSVFQVPAGAVKVAIGAEYRNESAKFVPDAASQAGTIAGNQIPATQGAFDVKEAFGEGLLPVFKDLPFAQYVELNGAVRFAHYSTAGDATSWKYGATWQVTDDFKLRADDASATRAPNIAELYAPRAQTFPGISTDLCSAPANPNAVANCATQIAALGAPLPGEPATPGYGGSTGLAAKQGVGGYTSGNSSLKPETALSLTAGIVYTPSWLQGFQLTSDYYDIRVHGYIGSLDPQQTQQACYNAPASQFATNPYCQVITRAHDVTLGPILKQIDFPTQNFGSIKTSGIDTTITYAFDLGDFDNSLKDAGGFNISLNTVYTSHYDIDPGVEGVDVIKTGGNAGLEMWRGLLRTTYTNGPLEFTTSLHYIGPSFVSKDSALPAPNNTTELEGNRIPSFWYVDLNVAYDVTDNVQAYAGANNLFDTRPPETFPGSGFDDTGTGTIATVYDPIGLFIYGGVNLKM